MGETKERTRGRPDEEKKRARARARERGLPKAGGGRLERGSASRERAASLPPPWRPSPPPSGPKPLPSPLSSSLVWWCTRSLLSCHFVRTYSSSGFPGMVILRSLPPFFSFFVAARALGLSLFVVRGRASSKDSAAHSGGSASGEQGQKSGPATFPTFPSLLQWRAEVDDLGLAAAREESHDLFRSLVLVLFLY